MVRWKNVFGELNVNLDISIVDLVKFLLFINKDIKLFNFDVKLLFNVVIEIVK